MRNHLVAGLLLAAVLGGAVGAGVVLLVQGGEPRRTVPGVPVTGERPADREPVAAADDAELDALRARLARLEQRRDDASVIAELRAELDALRRQVGQLDRPGDPDAATEGTGDSGTADGGTADATDPAALDEMVRERVEAELARRDAERATLNRSLREQAEKARQQSLQDRLAARTEATLAALDKIATLHPAQREAIRAVFDQHARERQALSDRAREAKLNGETDWGWHADEQAAIHERAVTGLRQQLDATQQQRVIDELGEDGLDRLIAGK